jgi:hypothetical protein
MLQQQDELLRLSIWQGSNQQSVNQTEHSGRRADRERYGENGNRCKSWLLQQLAQSKSNIL